MLQSVFDDKMCQHYPFYKCFVLLLTPICWYYIPQNLSYTPRLEVRRLSPAGPNSDPTLTAQTLTTHWCYSDRPESWFADGRHGRRSLLRARHPSHQRTSVTRSPVQGHTAPLGHGRHTADRPRQRTGRRVSIPDPGPTRRALTG